MSTSKPKSARGFATLTPERRREIAAAGGRAAHAAGTAHKYTTKEASAAGRKGGEAVAKDREHMAEIGRKGGHNKKGYVKPRETLTKEDVATDVPPVEGA